MVVGAFGAVSFEVGGDTVRTWQSLSRSGKARWVEHQVLDLKEKLQFVGLELERVEMSVILVSPWCEPSQELARLRALRDSGERHKLIIGTRVFGYYVLADLDEEWKRTDGQGRPLVITCRLRLKEYN